MNRILFFTFLLLLSFPNSILSQWERTGGPSGGATFCVAANAQYLFAGATNGIFQSSDNGISWKRLENGLPPTFTCETIRVNEENIVLVSKGHIYLSRDNGNSWNQVFYPSSIVSFDIAVNDSLLFMVVSKVILKSTNDGMTWDTIYQPVYPFFLGAKIQLFDQNLYVTTRTSNDDHIFYSGNLGSSWNIIDIPFGYTPCILYTKDSLIIYVGEAGVNVSFDTGLNWTRASGWVNAIGPKQIVNINDTFYLNSRVILQSGNNGLNWQRVPMSTDSFNFRGLEKFNNSLFGCTQNLGIQKYSISENKFTQSDYGIDATHINCFGIYGNELWTGLNLYGLYRYDLLNNKWDTSNYFHEHTSIIDIAWIGDKILVLTSAGKVFQSADSGHSWVNISPNNFDKFSSILVNEQNLYLFDTDSCIAFQSTDEGENWTIPFPGFFIQQQLNPCLFIPLNSSLFVGANNQIFRSDDNGETWVPKNTGIDFYMGALTRIFSSGNILFVEGYEKDQVNSGYIIKIYASFDNGDHWESAMDGLDRISLVNPLSGQIKDVLTYNDTLVIVFKNNGLYYMTHGEFRWHYLSEKFNYPKISLLAYKDGTIFAGTESQGVWKMNTKQLYTHINEIPNPFLPLNIHPNPALSEITINPLEVQNGEGLIYIFDMIGHLITFEKVVLDSKITINISHFPVGNYIIRLISDNHVFQGNFIKTF